MTSKSAKTKRWSILSLLQTILCIFHFFHVCSSSGPHSAWPPLSTVLKRLITQRHFNWLHRRPGGSHYTGIDLHAEANWLYFICLPQKLVARAPAETTNRQLYKTSDGSGGYRPDSWHPLSQFQCATLRRSPWKGSFQRTQCSLNISNARLDNEVSFEWRRYEFELIKPLCPPLHRSAFPLSQAF